MPSKNKPTLKLGSVFSGIGAVEHALKRMNVAFDLTFACDIDSFAKETFFANHKIDETRWYDDIRELSGRKYFRKIDLLVGGSPCQSFSMVGKRKGLEDDRGNLIFEFIRLINEIKPKVFIFENVRGLISHNGGETWQEIQNAFSDLGYHFHSKVLNAKDYGIPQNRERLFVVGFRKYRKFDFPERIPLELTMQDLLQDTADSKYTLGEKGVQFVTKQKNLDKKYTQVNGEIALCQKANQQFNWHGDFVSASGPVDNKYYLSEKVKKYVLASGTKDFYSKPKTDLPVARPLLSTMAKMHRAGVDNYITRGKKLRKLTPRECLRLMGFSDDFKIVVSDTQAYKQAGNAIVVNVLIHVLQSIGIEQYADADRTQRQSVWAKAKA